MNPHDATAQLARRPNQRHAIGTRINNMSNAGNCSGPLSDLDQK